MSDQPTVSMRERLKAPPAREMVEAYFRPTVAKGIEHQFVPEMHIHLAHGLMLARCGIVPESALRPIVAAVLELLDQGRQSVGQVLREGLQKPRQLSHRGGDGTGQAGQQYLTRGQVGEYRELRGRYDSTVKDPNDHRPWETFSRWQDNGGYYKYFWWGISRGKNDYGYMGIGTYGQFIFVSPRTKVVIVRTADEDGIDPRQWREVFQNIAEHVDETYGR